MFCRHFGLIAFPVSVGSISRFLTDYMEDEELHHANSPNEVIFTLQEHCQDTDEPWLSEEDLEQVHQVRKSLKQAFFRTPHSQRFNEEVGSMSDMSLPFRRAAEPDEDYSWLREAHGGAF